MRRTMAVRKSSALRTPSRKRRIRIRIRMQTMTRMKKFRIFRTFPKPRNPKTIPPETTLSLNPTRKMMICLT